MSCEITLGEKLPEVIIGPFDADALQRYADVSGDMNPLHLDETLAQSIGFSLPPVHGMKILAAFEPMLKNWRSELIIIALSGKFVQPILRGESVKLTGKVLRVSDTEIFVRLFAHGPQRLPAIIGEARLRPPTRPSA
jgi:acyl dehydratase